MRYFNTLFSPNGQDIETETKQSNNEISSCYESNGLNISTEHFQQTQKNILSSQHCMEPFPKLTTYLDTKQVSTDTGKLK